MWRGKVNELSVHIRANYLPPQLILHMKWHAVFTEVCFYTTPAMPTRLPSKFVWPMVHARSGPKQVRSTHEYAADPVWDIFKYVFEIITGVDAPSLSWLITWLLAPNCIAFFVHRVGLKYALGNINPDQMYVRPVLSSCCCTNHGKAFAVVNRQEGHPIHQLSGALNAPIKRFKIHSVLDKKTPTVLFLKKFSDC